MKIVSDAGPLIGLAKIECLSILKTIASEVFIPPIVYRELLGKVSFEYESIEAALDDFIRVAELTPVKSEINDELKDLGEGEKQAIILASMFSEDALLLIDDLAGRKAAEKLNISKTGLVGILLLAKERGIIKKIGPLIDELRSRGYWLSDEIVMSIKHLAGEGK